MSHAAEDSSDDEDGFGNNGAVTTGSGYYGQSQHQQQQSKSNNNNNYNKNPYQKQRGNSNSMINDDEDDDDDEDMKYPGNNNNQNFNQFMRDSPESPNDKDDISHNNNNNNNSGRYSRMNNNFSNNHNNSNSNNNDNLSSEGIWLDLQLSGEVQRVFFDNKPLSIQSTFGDVINYLTKKLCRNIPNNNNHNNNNGSRFGNTLKSIKSDEWFVQEPDFGESINNEMTNEKTDSERTRYETQYSKNISDLESEGRVILGREYENNKSIYLLFDIDIQSNNLESICKFLFNRKLILSTKPFKVRIMNGKSNEFDIEVRATQTIRFLKSKIFKERNEKIDKLVYKGVMLPDDTNLSEHGITKDGCSIHGQICIIVKDKECDVYTEVLIYEDWPISQVITEYCNRERREKHASAHIYFSNNDELDENETVYNYQIQPNNTLRYTVDSYFVNVFDGDSMMDSDYLRLMQENRLNQANNSNNNNNNNNRYSNEREERRRREQLAMSGKCQRIEVLDSWNISQLKDAYSRITKKPFMPNERILCGARELEENVSLWKLRIKDDENLMIEREQQDKPTEYICSDCGVLVKLGKFDTIQCRECWNQIVFKKRTTRVCQYNCR